jgi:hypothetical protein
MDCLLRGDGDLLICGLKVQLSVSFKSFYYYWT